MGLKEALKEIERSMRSTPAYSSAFSPCRAAAEATYAVVEEVGRLIKKLKQRQQAQPS